MNKKEKIAALVVLLLYMLYCLDFSEPSPLKQVANEHGRYMKKVHQCRLEGIGSRGPEKYEEIILSYGSYQKIEEINVNDARKLILDSTQKLLEIVNSNTEIQDSLANHPYTADNLDVSISLRDPATERRYLKNYIALVYLLDGEVHYVVDDPETGFLKNYKLETYSEALSAVKEKE